ncbi:alpha/beta hydrolase [Oleiharenicola lentus]|uniref:alpha/beta hydrolase n=1 Tax=Oleiharenicola lentus TaxID=2508720 RepID=UPI003F66A936
MSRKFALKAAIAAIVCYGLVAIAAQGLVGSMLYFPEYGSRREPAGAVRLKMADGAELCALYLPNPKARHTLWYFHGNAEDLGDIEPRLREFHARGFAVFACDYPGYGQSGGQPSEKSIYAANEVAKTYLSETLRVPLAQIILYGRSLGGGSAVDLASKHGVGGLVLENAFTSVFRVMTRWPLLPGDQFKNAKKISTVRCPVLIMHSREDRVVPFHHGETLLKQAREPKQHYWVDLAGHNNLGFTAGEEYWKRLLGFTSGI